MKYLLTAHQFFPDHASGTEVLTLSVARELRRRGHEVRILTGFPTPAEAQTGSRTDTYEYDGFRVYRSKSPTSAQGGASLVRMRYDDAEVGAYARAILQDYQPDLVHVFHLDRLGGQVIDTAKSLDLPIFMTPTDFWMVCPTAQLSLPGGAMCSGPQRQASNCVKHLLSLQSKGKLDPILNRIPALPWSGLVRIARAVNKEVAATVERPEWIRARINQLDGILVPNKMMRKVLLQNGITPALLHMSRFGIEADTVQDGPPKAYRTKAAQVPLRVGFIGTLAPHKGCDVLLKAAKDLPSDEVEVHIYGNPAQFPEYMSELRQLAANQSNVTFHDPFPNAQIAQIFAQLDVLIVPSVWFENTPLVVYSAQQALCPVIVSDLPGLTEVIEHDQNGLSFPPAQSKALAAQLLRLIKEPTLLEVLSRNAKQPRTIQDYTDDLRALWGHAQGAGA